jgi:predicted DNA-binding protein
MSARLDQRMPDELHDRISKFADELGVSKNALINMACEEFLRTGKIEEIEKRLSEIENVKIPILDDRIDQVNEDLRRHNTNYED